MSNRISACLIARNAGQSIYECIKSFEQYVDEIIVVLAGKSTDNTAMNARKASSKVQLFNFDWVDDFSAARNYSFSKATGDFLMWLDSDDILQSAENLPKLVENAPPNISAIWFPYYYSFDDAGNCTTLFIRERLMRASNGWVWRSRVHETVAPINPPYEYARSTDVSVYHKHMEVGGSRSDRNFRLLEIMHKEDPEDRRVWMYIGFQHFAGMNWNKAIEWFMKFASDDKVLPIEKYQCLTYAGRALRQVNNFQDAIKLDLMAIELFPEWADGYIGLAGNYMGLGQWQKGLQWGDMAKQKSPPEQMIFVNPLDYAYNLLTTMFSGYVNTMQFDKAIEALETAGKVRPNDPFILDNLERTHKAIQRKNIYDGVEKLYAELASAGDWAKVAKIPDILPEWMRWLPETQQLALGAKSKVNQPKTESPLTKEQEEWIDSEKQKYGKAKVITNLEQTTDDELPDGTVILTVGHQKEKVRHFSDAMVEKLLISKPGREILTIHNSNNFIGATYRDATEPKHDIMRIFCGMGFEEWTPYSMIKQGMGGSETMAAELAHAFQQRDYQSFIYTNASGVYDGVRYTTPDKFNNAPCDILISSRVPDVYLEPRNAQHKFLWFHDVHRWDRFTPQIAENIDYLNALTKWHAWYLEETYPFLKDCEVIDKGHPASFIDDDCPTTRYYENERIFKKPKITVIGNGIHTHFFEKLDVRRRDFRFIWSSSPDRGLLELLQYWPKIRKEFKGAQLQIFYGWEYFDSTLFIPYQRELKEKLLTLLNQPGVHWRGRVGQKELAQEFKMAHVWYYPLHYSDIVNKDAGGFRETFGITAVEAQAAGCLCVARASGGIGETVADRGVLIPLDAGEKELDYLFDLLYATSRQAELREKGREWAMKQTWASIADKVEEVCGQTV